MTDESKNDEWGPEAIVNLLRRQIAELEAARAKLVRRGENADDNELLMDALLEIREFRKDLADMEAELGGKSEGDDE